MSYPGQLFPLLPLTLDTCHNFGYWCEKRKIKEVLTAPRARGMLCKLSIPPWSQWLSRCLQNSSMRWWGSLFAQLAFFQNGFAHHWLFFWIQLSKRTCSISLLFLCAFRADLFVFLPFCFFLFLFYFLFFCQIYWLCSSSFDVGFFNFKRKAMWMAMFSGLCILTSVFLGTCERAPEQFAWATKWHDIVWSWYVLTLFVEAGQKENFLHTHAE